MLVPSPTVVLATARPKGTIIFKRLPGSWVLLNVPLLMLVVEALNRTSLDCRAPQSYPMPPCTGRSKAYVGAVPPGAHIDLLRPNFAEKATIYVPDFVISTAQESINVGYPDSPMPSATLYQALASQPNVSDNILPG